MRQAVVLTAIVAALFCALYAFFLVVAASTPHPAPKKPSQPEIKRVWV